MSFVSKGEKKVKNGQKAGAKPGETKAQPKDGFGKKGQPKNHNELPKTGSDNAESESPGSEAVDGGEEYNPKKRPGSIKELRYMASMVMSGDDQTKGQEGKNNSSKNSSGFGKKGAQGGDLLKKSKAKPHAESLEGEIEGDPLDEDMEENEQTEEGMTPKGKKRNRPALRKVAKMAKED